MFNLSLNVSKNILGYSNLAAGFPKVPMKVNLSSGAISIIGAVLLIPKLGYIGAAYALIIMNFYALASYLFYLKKIKINVAILNHLKPYILLLIVMGVYLVINVDSTILKSSAVLIYLILNWIFISDFRDLIKSFLKVIPTS
jgi:O-antigen/teichoic acid export membrane protein